MSRTGTRKTIILVPDDGVEKDAPNIAYQGKEGGETSRQLNAWFLAFAATWQPTIKIAKSLVGTICHAAAS